MRIIKLSASDPDMATPELVKVFFTKVLRERNPPGKFRLPSGWISEKGIQPGERLLFTYLGQCVYQARSASGRVRNTDEESGTYPFYFCLDVASLVQTTGNLADLQGELTQQGLSNKNLRSQGWPSLDETPEICGVVDRLFGKI